jgi:hypothetical protein
MTEHKLAFGRAQLDRSALALNDGGPLSFVASTEGMNRYGYSLRNDGWRLDNYNANPVVLWMHDPWTPPIATGVAVSKNKTIVLDNVVFDADDELAALVESKYRRGFLSAVSVSWDFVTDAGVPVDSWWGLEQEQIDELFYDLCEISAVTVPGDPGALIKQSRLALRKLGKELVEMLDDGEKPESTVTLASLQAAVVAELDRRGVSVPALNTPPEAPAEGITQDAAQGLLAVFATEGTAP